MLDDESGVGRRKPVHRTVEERAAIVAETYIAKHMDGLKRFLDDGTFEMDNNVVCLLYTSPSPRDKRQSRMPSSA